MMFQSVIATTNVARVVVLHVVYQLLNANSAIAIRTLGPIRPVEHPAPTVLGRHNRPCMELFRPDTVQPASRASLRDGN
jgi:hypothetical protein